MLLWKQVKDIFSMSNEKFFKKKNTYLKTLILQMQTTTEKIELIGYLILGEIKLCNLENVHFEKNSLPLALSGTQDQIWKS